MVEGRGLLAAFESREDGTWGYNFDGTKPSHVQWALVDTQEAGHDTVIEVVFNANDPENLVNDNGWFGIVADVVESTTVDLGEFAEGALTFDMRILKNGDTVDVLDVRMDCVWPCASEELWVADPPELNSWRSYSFPMERLVATGLDIHKVNNLFEFKPRWGAQFGQYVIQIDNIRLTKQHSSEIHVPPLPSTSFTKVLYRNADSDNFGAAVIANPEGPLVSLSDVVDGGSTLMDLHVLADLSTPFLFIYSHLGNRSSMTEYFHGELVFDMRVLSYGDISGGEFYVHSNCGWPCRAAPSYAIGRPAQGEWLTHRVPVRELVARGLDLSRISEAMVFGFSGAATQGLHVQLNNIRWEYVSQGTVVPPPEGCAETGCELFMDSTRLNLGSLATFVLHEDNTAEFTFGTGGPDSGHVQWDVVQLSEPPSFNKVLEVRFNGDDPLDLINDNGWFGITVDTNPPALTTVDLSAFAKGVLTFNMRIIENGAVPNLLEFSMECLWPCHSAEALLQDPPELGQWKNYAFPMEQLIASGLDITQVNHLLVFKPRWGSQLGQYVIQLDNILLLNHYDPEAHGY